MPRSKKSVATKRVDQPTSDDAVATVPAIDADAVVVDVDACVADGLDAPDAVKDETKKVGPKAARRAKTCEKCVQRRDREREYARIARAKSRSLKDAKKDASVAPATTPVETAPAVAE